MEKFSDVFNACLAIILVVICMAAISTLVFMALWNWIIPLIWTSAPEINFWEAFGIMMLLSIIGSLIFKK